MSRDGRDREIARTGTDRSFLVEASAGTGKTRTLVERILEHVLEDPEAGGIPITSLAALTFTEKAAGEMKDRVRGALEKAAAGGNARARRAEAALVSLDLAMISTIHAFCAALLHERPVDAGVDPGFTTTEPGIVRDLLEETFAEWLDEEARRDGPLQEALGAGLSPDALLELAGELFSKRTTIGESAVPADALEEARERMEAILSAASALLAELPADAAATDRGAQLSETISDVEPLRALDLAALSSASLGSRIDFRRGKKPDPEWKTRAEELRDGVKGLAALLPTLPRSLLLARLVERMRAALFPHVQAKKRERAFLDYDDLLLCTRDVLRRSRAVREHFSERFRTLLVDEFQDTDPVQAEIVLRLSSDAADERPFTELDPVPGELFLVGDPKQAIYRFRSADVETYAAVKRRFSRDDLLGLSASFRSDPRLVAWVNRVFEQVLVADPARPWEVGYTPLEAEREPKGAEPPVLYLLPPEDAGTTRLSELRTLEAAAVANLLDSRFRGKVEWRDVAVLVPSNAAIDELENALRAAGVPSVAEGGKSYTKREETAAVVAALRAIADPGDGFALAAALKSFLFAATDADLVEAAERGFLFDVAGEAPAGTAIAPAVALVQRLRAGRHGRPADETLLALLRERSAFASLLAGATGNPKQAVANVERLVATARALDGEGLSFGEIVRALERSLDEDAPEPRAVEEREDAVRILTLHKSKGLEFPVVVLAGLGLSDRERAAGRATVCFDRPGGRLGARLTLDGESVRTPRFEEILRAGAERLEAEERRLLYVGATRAKDRLVLSWWGSDVVGRSYLSRVSRARDVSPFPPGTVEEVASDTREPATPLPREEEPADPTSAMRDADARLERARAGASRALKRAGEHAAAPGRLEDLPAADREENAAQDRALRVGVAVHEAMERLLDPSRPEPPLAEVLGEVAAELPPEARADVQRLVKRLLADEVTERAKRARRRFVEVPLFFRDGEGPEAPLVEGKIDLLFEEEDGLVVVDWKTDRVDSPGTLAERRALYQPQLAAYAEGLRRALGPGARVKETLLVFARA